MGLVREPDVLGAGLFLRGGVEVIFVVGEKDEAVDWLADLRAPTLEAVVLLFRQDVLGGLREHG